MKINKLKALSIAACCAITALWAEVHGMDTPPQLEEKTSHNILYEQSCSQNEVDALDVEATPSQSIILKDFQTSWWLSYPIYMANEFICKFWW
jgi:hypothetical protein